MSSAACEIPFVELGEDGPDLHFAHANGFPAECYRSLLQRLAGFRVLAMNQRPLWPGSRPEEARDWRIFADDLIRFLDTCARPPVVGVGHSLGGTATALAAVRRPDLFSALVLIDPVFLPRKICWYWGPMKRLGLAHILPLARTARRRRTRFESQDEARRRFRRAPAFATLSDEAIEDYAAGAVEPDPAGGVRLRYPAAWEARVYETTPHDVWRFIPRIPGPVLVLRGERSDTLMPPAWARLARVLPAAERVEIPGTGHLLPLERPREVAEAILSFCRRRGLVGGDGPA